MSLNRTCTAVITAALGRGGTRQFPLKRVQAYAVDQSIDNDADSFSFDVGNIDNDLELLLDRDVEVRANLFITDQQGATKQIFSGICDDVQQTLETTLSFQGRDVPSSLSVDSDALPGRWSHLQPQKFIAARAMALGISNIKIAKMSQMSKLYTDGSEKEWSLWYRIARNKGMWQWSDNTGALIIDKLGYALTPTYKFGHPVSGSASGWLQVEDVTRIKSTAGRKRRVIVYGEDAKKGQAFIAQGVDTTIGGWKKKPLSILTSSIAKSTADAQKEANEEIFDSIVGSQEISLTVQDTGVLIEQNKMAVVNIPERGITGTWFIVGVQRTGGAAGFTQLVRLREKGFAVSKKIPQAPVLAKDPNAVDTNGRPAGSIAAALSGMPGIRWADSFVRAANEYGVKNGWDFAVFLGVLLSICQQETSFHNIRQRHSGAINDEEWLPYESWVNSGARLSSKESAANLQVLWQETFANAGKNIINPFTPDEAGVGPMQLTSTGVKALADKFGWSGKSNYDEYAGGRWNTDSNILAAASLLIDKLKAFPPADPTNPDTIWVGVQRYNGSGPDAVAYAKSVKTLYLQFGEIAKSAVAATAAIPAGATTNVTIPGYGVLKLDSNVPNEVRKAINFCLRHFGDAYEWGGFGPNYDCSGLVTAALEFGSPQLNAILAGRGESTYTLFKRGRFRAVTKDQLLPGDLVFFRGDPPEHVGMYLADGLFIHDNHPGGGVVIANIGESYYVQNWTGARRVVTWPTGQHPGTN